MQHDQTDLIYLRILRVLHRHLLPSRRQQTQAGPDDLGCVGRAELNAKGRRRSLNVELPAESDVGRHSAMPVNIDGDVQPDHE